MPAHRLCAVPGNHAPHEIGSEHCLGANAAMVNSCDRAALHSEHIWTRAGFDYDCPGVYLAARCLRQHFHESHVFVGIHGRTYCSGLIVSGTRTGRVGDSQPMPTVNSSPDIQSMVIHDIEKRRELGISRYGTALQPNNGRDALQDAYEESIDLAMYLKQAIVERDK